MPPHGDPELVAESTPSPDEVLVANKPVEPTPITDAEPVPIDAERAGQVLWSKFEEAARFAEPALDLSELANYAHLAQGAPPGSKADADDERALVRRHRDAYVALQARIARATQVEEEFLAGSLSRDQLVRFVAEISRLHASLAPLESEHGGFAQQVQSVRSAAARVKAHLERTLAANPPLPEPAPSLPAPVERAERVPPKRPGGPLYEQFAEEVRTRRNHPGRKEGGSEAVLRAKPASQPAPPLDEKEVRERETARMNAIEDARARGELFAAAHIARAQKYVVATSKKKDPEGAIAAAQIGCQGAAFHLRAVKEGSTHGRATGPVSNAFVDAWATCGFLLDEIADLDPERTKAGELQAALAMLQPPPGWKPPSKQIQQRIALLQKPEEDRDYLLAVTVPLDQAREVLAAVATDQRDRQTGVSPHGGESDVGKPARFANAVKPAVPHLERVAAAIGRGTFDADRARLRPSIDAYLAAAERFVRSGMAQEPFAREASEHVHALSLPIATWAGRRAPIVAPLVVVEGDRDASANLVTSIDAAFRHVFSARAVAVRELAARPAPPVKVPWQESLFSSIVELGLTALIGGLTGGMGAAVAQGVTGTIARTMVADGAKAVLRDLVKNATTKAKSGNADPRRRFFESQQHALNDQQLLTMTVTQGLIEEVKTQPDARSILHSMKQSFSYRSDELGKEQKRQCVQDWAIYLAGAVHDTDEVGGVDMTGVGRGLPDGAVEETDVRMPSGVLEIDVELSTGKPRIVRALAGGMRQDDLDELTTTKDGKKQPMRIRDVRMPTQFRIYNRFGGRRVNEGQEHIAHELPLGEFTDAAHLVISRNEMGSLWLRDASRAGRAYITRKYGGDPGSDADVLRAAARFISELDHDNSERLALHHVEAS